MIALGLMQGGLWKAATYSRMLYFLSEAKGLIAMLNEI